MPYFHGILQGQSSRRVTRCGTRRSGIESIVAGTEGSVHVTLWRDIAAGVDMARVHLEPWADRRGNSHGEYRVLYEGPISGQPAPTPIEMGEDGRPTRTPREAEPGSAFPSNTTTRGRRRSGRITFPEPPPMPAGPETQATIDRGPQPAPQCHNCGLRVHLTHDGSMCICRTCHSLSVSARERRRVTHITHIALHQNDSLSAAANRSGTSDGQVVPRDSAGRPLWIQAAPHTGNEGHTETPIDIPEPPSRRTPPIEPSPVKDLANGLDDRLDAVARALNGSLIDPAPPPPPLFDEPL